MAAAKILKFNREEKIHLIMVQKLPTTAFWL